MSQIRLDPALLNGDTFILEGPEAHHLARVLRSKAGDTVQLFDGRGRRFQGLISKVDSKVPRVEGRITQTISSSVSSATLALYQGLPKGSKFDYVIEKATELGADEIIPFVSEKSLIKLDETNQATKLARWQRVAEAAARQCDRPSVPVLEPARPLKDLKWDRIGGTLLILSCSSGSRGLKSLWPTVKNTRINILVGPESGFSKKEEEALLKAGGHLISLGSLTLRTETAGLAALAILRHELEG